MRRSRHYNFPPKANDQYRTVPESSIIETLLLAGWAFEVDGGRRDWAEGKCHDALEAWIALGLGFRRSPDGRRSFDPVEVTNFLKWAGITGQDAFWTERYVATGRALVTTFAREPLCCSCPSKQHPVRFRITYQRAVELRGIEEGARVRLRSPLPLPGPYLHDLNIEQISVLGCEAKIVVRPDRLEVQLMGARNGAVSINTVSSFVPLHLTGGSAAALTSEDAELYLRKVEGFVRVTPRVEALAMSLSAECHTNRETIAAFWDYMIDELLSGMIRYSEISTASALDWVLDHGWYDCQLGSALLVSLCRARGIPARIIGGHLLYRLAPINHYWAEIWIEDTGWSPFDLFCWDLSKGGQDPEWRNIFMEHVDLRAVTQCLPLAFTGSMSIPFPARWHMVQVGDPRGGVDVKYLNVEDGSSILRDHVVVERLGAVDVGQAARHDKAI